MSQSSYERAQRIQFDAAEGYDIDTLSVRAGQSRTAEGEHSDAIFPTSSFVFSSAREAAARFGGEEEGNIYSRFTNPTVQAFEERIAALEGGERAVATASGMAAILNLGLALLQQGDHVVCSRSVFGSTVSLFTKYLSRAGITTAFVDPTDTAAWEAAVTPKTRLFFMETPSNPLAELSDIAAVAEIAHRNNALLCVDNCFLTRPCSVRFSWVQTSSCIRQPSIWMVRGAVSAVCWSVATRRWMRCSALSVLVVPA